MSSSKQTSTPSTGSRKHGGGQPQMTKKVASEAPDTEMSEGHFTQADASLPLSSPPDVEMGDAEAINTQMESKSGKQKAVPWKTLPVDVPATGPKETSRIVDEVTATTAEEGTTVYKTEIWTTSALPSKVRSMIMDQNPALYDLSSIANSTPDDPLAYEPFELSTKPVEYEKRDMPSESQVHKDMAKNKAYSAVLHVEYSKDQRPLVGNRASAWFGRGFRPSSSEVKIGFNVGTQVPNISIRIPRTKDSNFSATQHPTAITIFGRHIPWVNEGDADDRQRLRKGLNLHFLYGSALKKFVKERWGPDISNFPKNLDAGNTLGITFNIADECPVSGLSPAEFLSMKDRALTSTLDERIPEGTNERDAFAVTAWCNCKILLVFQTDAKHKEGVDKSTGMTYEDIGKSLFYHLKKMMTVTKIDGDLWFYHRQQKAGLFQPGNFHSTPIVPLWLVSEWRCTKRQDERGDDVYTQVQPWKWGKLNLSDKFDTLPDYQTMLLALRIGVARQQQYQTSRLASCLQSQDGLEFDAEFILLEDSITSTACYAVFVFCTNPDLMTEKGMIEPTIDTRMTITVQTGEKKGLSVFRGVVQPNNARPDATFALVMTGKVKQARDFPVKDQRYPIQLSAVDDMLPTERRLAAIRSLDYSVGNSSLAPNLSQAPGVDFRGIVTGFRDSSKCRTNEYSRSLSPEQRKMFYKVIQTARMNQEQAEWATRTINSESGMEMLFGPPGTGKTSTVISTIAAHAAMGTRVLFTCGQNKPTQHGVVKFHEFVAARGREWGGLESHEYVYFNSAGASVTSSEALKIRQHAKPLYGPGETPDDNPESTQLNEEAKMKQLLNDMYRQGAPSFGELDISHSFGQKLKSRIYEYARRPGSGFEKDLAQRYEQYSNSLKGLSREERKQNLENLRIVEAKLARWYLENEVKVVFCTNSMSVHEVLLDGFQPKLLAMEEAAHTTLPDLMTPIAGYGVYPRKDGGPLSGSIWQIIMAGDDKQSKPETMGEFANEFHSMMRMELFKSLRETANLSHGVTMLKSCYRMPASLVAYPSHRWYGNELVSDPSVEHMNLDIKSTLNSMHHTLLGKAYNGGNIAAFDVSGPEVHHYQYRNSTSRANDAEADRIMDYVKFLLTYVHENGRRILPQDIGIISPYSGQAYNLQRRARERGILGLDINTIEQAQGNEWQIVIYSFVISMAGSAFPKAHENLPLRFVADGNRLCVALTRARCHLAIFGDFKCFAQCWTSRHACVEHNKNIGHLIQHLQSQKCIYPNDIWAWFVNQTQPPTKNTFWDDIYPLHILNLSTWNPSDKRGLPAAPEEEPKNKRAMGEFSNVQSRGRGGGQGGRGRGSGQQGRGRGGGRGGRGGDRGGRGGDRGGRGGRGRGTN